MTVAPGAPGGCSAGPALSPRRCVSAAPHRISRVPVEPFAVLPCSQTPVGPPRQAIRRFGAVGAHLDAADSRDDVISWLNRTASRLAVYASCRRLHRLRNTRFRVVATLSRVVITDDRVQKIDFVASLHLLRLRTFHGATKYDPMCSQLRHHVHKCLGRLPGLRYRRTPAGTSDHAWAQQRPLAGTQAVHDRTAVRGSCLASAHS
jgi:hypothetical protein